MRALVVYYSRTGTTKTVAEAIAKSLSCDIEAIVLEEDNTAGVKGYLKSSMEVVRKKNVTIKPPVKDPSEYDIVIVGTPVWVLSVSTPVKAYLIQQKDKIKKVAFFCTMGSIGRERAFLDMEEFVGQPPASTLTVRRLGVKKDQYMDSVAKFISYLK